MPSETSPLTALIAIVNENGVRTQYSFELRTAGVIDHGPLEQENTVTVSQPYVRNVCSEIDAALHAVASGRSQDIEALTEHAKALYNQLFRPAAGSAESNLIGRLRDSTHPLLIRSNERLVPWDLLHDGEQFLGLTHELGQSLVRPSPPPSGRDVRSLDKVLIVGDPLEDLPEARREAEHVNEWLSERGAECTVLLGKQATQAAVVRELTNEEYDLLHYCGHVTAANQSERSGLLLHDRQLLDETALQGIARIGAPPVVFINGCKTVGPVANICVGFMELGAKVVVGTRAEVAEGSARRFGEAFYRGLLEDQSVGAAMKTARQALSDHGDPSWASFLMYGNPTAHISGGVREEPVPARESSGSYDPEATALLDTVRAFGRQRGIVTSMDLLLGLVMSPALRTTLEQTIGATALAGLTRMLQDVAGVLSPDGPVPDDGPDVPLSDTVSSVLAKAGDRASAGGRMAVTSEDIATAFADLGGGSAGQVLALFGVSLKQLLGLEPVSGRTGRTPEADDVFDESGGLRDGVLDDTSAAAVRAATLLAASQQGVVATHVLLQGLGLAGSAVLRQVLEKQGPAGREAIGALIAPVPRSRHLSRRTRTALRSAASESRGAGVGTGVDEASLLLALVADEDSGARALLRLYGIDVDQLVRDIRVSRSNMGGSTGGNLGGHD